MRFGTSLPALLLATRLLDPRARFPRASLSPRTAATIAGGDVHVQDDFVPQSLVHALRNEMQMLARTGEFGRGTSHTESGSIDEMRSALTCTPSLESTAFSALFESLDDVRLRLSSWLGRELATGFECVYVLYPPGGFYRRHMDSVEGVDPTGSGRRVYSFIIYLNTPGWAAEDGGELRISTAQHEATRDIWPESGRLVIFDSKQVWHEVLPCFRERSCVVGWFRST